MARGDRESHIFQKIDRLRVWLQSFFIAWKRLITKAAVENMKQRLDSTELNSTEKPISKMNKEDLVGVAQTELGMVLVVDMDFEVLEEEPK